MMAKPLGSLGLINQNLQLRRSCSAPFAQQQRISFAHPPCCPTIRQTLPSTYAKDCSSLFFICSYMPKEFQHVHQLPFPRRPLLVSVFLHGMLCHYRLAFLYCYNGQLQHVPFSRACWFLVHPMPTVDPFPKDSRLHRLPFPRRPLPVSVFLHGMLCHYRLAFLYCYKDQLQHVPFSRACWFLVPSFSHRGSFHNTFFKVVSFLGRTERKQFEPAKTA